MMITRCSPLAVGKTRIAPRKLEEVAQPMRSNACSQASTACSMTGSRGNTRLGTCSVACHTETAVTSARVSWW